MDNERKSVQNDAAAIVACPKADHMFTVLLDTKDLGEAEAVFSATFSKMRISATSGDASAPLRLERASVGSMGLDIADYGIGFSYEMDPPGQILLCRVVSGGLEERSQGPRGASVAPGGVYASGAIAGIPYAGRLQQGHYEQLVIQPSLLNAVAAGQRGSAEPVRLTGSVPVSREATRHLFDTIGYVAHVAANRYAQDSPLIAAGLEQYVAMTMLATLPNTAGLEPTPQDHRDSTPVLLRRAIAYIDENAHTDICLTDIASAVYVTPRALQYMFRRHRDCTPMEYVRQVRLQHAHLDLVAGNRATTTVGAIARHWGFGHLGRFAVGYRENYGQSPHVTLATD
jgi:AraC-like DNA-binding protein